MMVIADFKRKFVPNIQEQIADLIGADDASKVGVEFVIADLEAQAQAWLSNCLTNGVVKKKFDCVHVQSEIGKLHTTSGNPEFVLAPIDFFAFTIFTDAD